MFERGGGVQLGAQHGAGAGCLQVPVRRRVRLPPGGDRRDETGFEAQLDRAVLVAGAGIDDDGGERHRSPVAGLCRSAQREAHRMHAEVEERAAAPVRVDAVVGPPRRRRLRRPRGQVGERADPPDAYQERIDGRRRSEVFGVEHRSTDTFLGLDQTVRVGERAGERCFDDDVVAGVQQGNGRVDMRGRGSGDDRDVAPSLGQQIVERGRPGVHAGREVGCPGGASRRDGRHPPVEGLAGSGMDARHHSGAPQHHLGSTLHHRRRYRLPTRRPPPPVSSEPLCEFSDSSLGCC